MTIPSDISGERPGLIHQDTVASAEHPLLNKAGRRAWLERPTKLQLLVSVLVAVMGILASKALGIVDKDLRSMYTEYTVAATNLAHSASDLLRYRVTIGRAIEAQNQKEFERISAALPDQQARIIQMVEQYSQASHGLLQRRSRGDQDLQGFRRSLQAYFASADQTMVYLTQQWVTSTPAEASALRLQAELNAAENAGPKLVEASDALERLLFGVADFGKEMREEGANAIRLTSLALVLGSLIIAGLNLLRP